MIATLEHECLLSLHQFSHIENRRNKLSVKRRNGLKKKAKRGFRGYPIATIAYYGPNDKFATKVAVGIIAEEGDEVVTLKR